MRFILAFVLSSALLCGCADAGETSDGFTEKTCLNSVDCCFSDDECAEGEYCEGEGACDSEGTCETIVSIPCPFVGDPATGVWTEPVCGCDGTTYQSSCVAGSAGARIAHEGECEGNPR